MTDKPEFLIYPKCGEEFPATTKHGPGPAKAKFAAHVNKCEGTAEANQLSDEGAMKGPGNVPPELWGSAKPLGSGEEAAIECTPIETTIIKETLKVPLLDADYKNFAILMGQARTEISAAEDGLKSVKLQFNKKQ